MVGRISVSRSFSQILIKNDFIDFLLIRRYLISQPFLRVFTKSPTAAIQSILHVLFLPTPFKLLSQTTFVPTSTSNSTSSTSTANPDGANKSSQPQGPIDASLLDIPEEVLVPGALYTDCAVVVNLAVKLDSPDIQTQVNGEVKPGAETPMNEETRRRGVIELSDDSEYGGELAGRLVWEAYEAGLKVWERENPRPVVEEKVGDGKAASGASDTRKETQMEEKNEDADKDVYF